MKQLTNEAKELFKRYEVCRYWSKLEIVFIGTNQIVEGESYICDIDIFNEAFIKIMGYSFIDNVIPLDEIKEEVNKKLKPFIPYSTTLSRTINVLKFNSFPAKQWYKEESK